jgi:hypothetical protein
VSSRFRLYPRFLLLLFWSGLDSESDLEVGLGNAKLEVRSDARRMVRDI